MVRISVVKPTEKGVFEGRFSMSAVLEQKGAFEIENSQKSEKGDFIYHTLISNFVSWQMIISKCHLAFYE